MNNPTTLLSPFKLRIKSKIKDLMCSLNERVLVEHLTSSKIKEANFSFNEYYKQLEENNWQDIRKQFPVMDNVFVSQKKNIEHLFNDITNAFYEDKTKLQEKGIIRNDYLQDIKIGEGDFHNGASTSIIEFISKRKLIYKPTNGNISQPYFQFLNWLSQYFDLGNYQYQILNKDNYHWQEFVFEKHCNTTEELQTYYQRAGSLLCVLYVLNASDYHAENLIAHGDTPVIIDHETIIQPKISDRFKENFKQFNEGQEDTVLNSFLLPNKDTKASFPVGICGLGYSKETYGNKNKKVSVNRFTENWKMVDKLIKENYIKHNVPTLNGELFFVEAYLQDFLKGFEDCYQLFLKQREYLLSQESPIQHFKNSPLRYIWRSTSIYGEILNCMKLPINLKDKALYKQKIRMYLSIAFKNTPKDSPLLNILEHEITQMLRGDIPYFQVNASSRDLETEHGVIKNFFELSAVENIERKIKILSIKDLEHQKKLIIESVQS